MIDLSRREFVYSAPALIAGTSLLAACNPAADSAAYQAAAVQAREPGPGPGDAAHASLCELVRHATLAPSSHNTQCWKFALHERQIAIHADTARRCPAVDPDDHHLYVSLGCAIENLGHAALAHGLKASPVFDPATRIVTVALAPTKAETSDLFGAIAARQCTRRDYDGRPLGTGELDLLERAGSSEHVRVLMLTGRAAIERVLAFVVQANTPQMADPAFVRELKTWIRFNDADALRLRDGLYSGTTGNPTIPTWLGERAFGWFYTPQGENDKYARQLRSSAGIAVFVARESQPASWIDVGRCYERFALQATALGIRNALVNQPVEIAAVRPVFATALGLGARRPDLVVRFGRGPVAPYSLRRPVASVLI